MSTDGPKNVIEVFLMAENRLLRDALGKVLGRRSDIRVVATVATAADVTARVAELRPQVLLLDSILTESDQQQAATLIPPGMPRLKIVMIGMEANRETFLNCVRAGISGYLLKDASATDVITAVRTVAVGGAICPPSLCQVLFEYFANQCLLAPNYYGKVQLGLTRREQELAHMISTGLSNKEIAVKLNLSEQTVKNHVHHMLRKLGTDNRIAAVELCRMHGLLAAVA